jgi:hypothetical protein
MLLPRRLLIRRLPSIPVLPGTRLHITQEVLCRTRELECIIFMQTVSATCRAEPNTRQDDTRQEHYADSYDRSIHVGTKKEE